MFFQAAHSLNENEFTVSHSTGISFPMHIHRSFEYFEQISGSTQVCIGEKSYTLTQGEAILVFPLQPHSYTCIEEGKLRMCIFSPDLVADFYKANENKVPTDHKFRCRLPKEVIAENHFHKSAAAYFICGEFEQGREYSQIANGPDDRLLLSLLLFADKNFCGECLLRDAAARIGYDYAYISKTFKRKVGISFRQYINNLRIIESKRLLKATVQGIEEIAEKCGFSSLRTFDREFREQTGITPSEYRKKHKKA